MSRRHLLMLLALSALWGASFMLIKVGVRDFSPAALVWLRLTVAAATLAPIALLGEPVQATALGGLALVLAGVALGTGAVRLTRRGSLRA